MLRGIAGSSPPRAFRAADAAAGDRPFPDAEALVLRASAASLFDAARGDADASVRADRAAARPASPFTCARDDPELVFAFAIESLLNPKSQVPHPKSQRR
jgi:hypothetical protein